MRQDYALWGQGQPKIKQCSSGRTCAAAAITHEYKAHGALYRSFQVRVGILTVAMAASRGPRVQRSHSALLSPSNEQDRAPS
jgi:hypothetical protein